MDAAEAPASPILARIASTAINQDGRSSSLTAPHGPSQQAVVSSALSSASCRPSEVQALELHGTGTPLGDPIELNAALAVLGSGTAVPPLGIHAAKSRVGHAEPAAGATGVCFALQRLLHANSTTVAGLGNLNPLLQATFADAIASGRDLSIGRGQHASGRPQGQRGSVLEGISAFAFQGTNAHVVLEEAAAPGDAQGAVGVGRGSSAPARLVWERRRCWHTPCAAVALASRFRTASDAFETMLSGRPRLGFLWDHVVGGRVLFPGAAMLEALSAAGACLLVTDTGDGRGGWEERDAGACGQGLWFVGGCTTGWLVIREFSLNE